MFGNFYPHSIYDFVFFRLGHRLRYCRFFGLCIWTEWNCLGVLYLYQKVKHKTFPSMPTEKPPPYILLCLMADDFTCVKNFTSSRISVIYTSSLKCIWNEIFLTLVIVLFERTREMINIVFISLLVLVMLSIQVKHLWRPSICT